MKRVFLPVLMVLLAGWISISGCGSDSSPGKVFGGQTDLGDAADTVVGFGGADADLVSDIAPGELDAAVAEAGPDFPVVPDAMEDVAADQPEQQDAYVFEDVPADQLEEDADVFQDVAADEGSPFVCSTASDCAEQFGAQPQCLEWECEQGECKAVAAPAGEECDDGDPCTVEDKCDGEGKCKGEPNLCEDGDICTQDSCLPGSGCVHNPVPPQDCVDENGNPGIMVCTNNAWSECKAKGVCNLKVNTNDTGTVNPFIFPARDGNFYVSYVANEDGGGNVKLAWVDPKSCAVVNGPFTVNETPGGAYYWGAQSALSDKMGNFYAVWEADSKLGEIHFSYSETGTDFKSPIEVVSVSENGVYPSMAVLSPGKPIIAWTGYIVVPYFPNGFSYDPFVSVNQNAFGGGAFEPAVHVAATEVQDDQTAIVVDDSGNVYVAWQSFQDGTDQGGNIYVAKSVDGGATFSPAVRVNDVPGKANVGISNFMAWGEGRLYVVWGDVREDFEGDVYIDSSEDGLTFGTDVLVNDSTVRYQEDPSVTVGAGVGCKGTVYVVWQDLRSNKSYEIYGAKSTDGGKTFEPNIMLNPVEDGDQMNPAIGVDHSCVVGVSWRDSSNNKKFDIYTTFKTKW